jgi:hypothetical protein
VDDQAQPAQRALSLEPCDEIVGELDPLEGLPEHELTGMKDERLAVLDRDQLGQLLHRLPHVDKWVARVVEDAEAPIHPHVDARRLHQRLVVGVEDQPSGGDFLLDRPIAKDHAASLGRAHDQTQLFV